ncbi:MAG: MarR family transcriptional regulator [Rhodoluna sp.]|nr:MarR family transcriptional regulator [Rhodoluna sp.]
MAAEKDPQGFDGPVFRATMLLREVIDSSAEYSRMVGAKLDVNETDFEAMQHLIERGPMTAGDLAKAVGVSPGSATVMIDRLVAVGHVTREPNPNDRRGVVVVPNRESVAEAWKLISPLITASEEALKKVTPEELAAIENYLNTMLKIYQDGEV